MNPSIRRRRRRTASPTTNLSLIDALSDSTDNDPDTPRKRKRRTANSDNIDPNSQLLPPDTESSLTEPTEEIPADDATSFQPTPPASPNIIFKTKSTSSARKSSTMSITLKLLTLTSPMIPTIGLMTLLNLMTIGTFLDTMSNS